MDFDSLLILNYPSRHVQTLCEQAFEYEIDVLLFFALDLK